MEVTLEAAPTTPEMTFRTCVLLQLYSAPSMLLIEPETKSNCRKNYTKNDSVVQVINSHATDSMHPIMLHPKVGQWRSSIHVLFTADTLASQR